MNGAKKLELKKAQFLTEYRQICEKYGMMQVMCKVDDYLTFVVTECNKDDIENIILESLINETYEMPH